MKPRASVVVPTCRRPQLLDRCLDALVAQDLCPSQYEILVADDAACDETRCQVERRARQLLPSGPCLRYVRPTVPRSYAARLRGRGRSPNRGPAAARNAGWRAALGDIIAFTDDDCIPGRDWLRAGSAALADGSDGASGRLIVPLPARPTDYERNACHLERAEFVTANCFYRRAALAH